MSKIKINFKWDEKTFLDSFEKIYDYEFKHSIKRYIGWFFIALLQIAVVATLKKGDITLLIFSTVVLVYWYYFKKLITKKLALKSFYKSDLKDKMISITATKDGMQINEVFIKWDEIELDELENGFLVITKSKKYFIPFSGFNSFEDRNEFKKLYKSAKNKKNANPKLS